MIRKYYVTCGDLKVVTHAHSGPQAIFFAFDTMAKEGVNNISTIIRVSQKGNEKHDDDELFVLGDMFYLWILNKNGIEHYGD